MPKTKVTKENILTLIQIWALTQEKFTSKKLAKFLGTTPRNAREYVRILRERGLVEGVDNVYELKKLDDKAGKLIAKITEKIANEIINVRELRERLNEVYDLLYEASDYTTTEWGDIINEDAHERISRALQILDEILHELWGGIMSSVLEEFAQKFAQRLFKLMPDFDRFDTVLHELEYLLGMMQKDDVKYVEKYYCLDELLGKIIHYRRTLEYLEKRLKELLSE